MFGISCTSQHHNFDRLLIANTFALHTLDVPCDVMKHVHHVWRSVLGPANTGENVACRAPHHVVVSHAVSAAPESYPADTSARDYVVKHVPKTSAKFVQFIMKPESIFSK